MENSVKRRSDLTADHVRQLLDYNPATGILVWRRREEGTIGAARFNAKYAGKTVGSVNHAGYIETSIYDKGYLVHRLIWLMVTGSWPHDEIDHINGDQADNRLDNLRAATRLQNATSRHRTKNKTGFAGVLLTKWGTYKAGIVKSGQKIHLGSFATAEEAHAAYIAASQRTYGTFCSKAVQPVEVNDSIAVVIQLHRSGSRPGQIAADTGIAWQRVVAIIARHG